MGIVDFTNREVGKVDIYNTNSGDGILKSIAITKFVKADEDGIVVKDAYGDTIVVSGFPVIVKYEEELDWEEAVYESKKAVSMVVAGAMKDLADINSADVDATDDTEESISEYSNDDICNMCSKYYFSVYGEEPPYAVVENEAGDKITVHLCEAIDEDTGYGFMSWAFYTIDRNTLSGYNDVSGEEIDLTPFAQ